MVAEVATIWRQMGRTLAREEAEIGAMSRLAKEGFSAWTRMMSFRKRARMMQPSHQIWVMAPRSMFQPNCSGVVAISLKPWA